MTATLLPPLAELLATARVVSIPLRVRFRGVTHREALLLRGPAGWGEFAPFLEYDAPEASRWLAAAVEAAYDGFPPPVRDTVPVNATVPPSPPTRWPASSPATTAAGPPRSRSPRRARPSSTTSPASPPSATPWDRTPGSASTPTGAGRW